MSPLARAILVESVVVPLVVAALVALAARLAPARWRPCAAGLAIVLGFAVGYGAIRGWPALLPGSATEKLPAVTLLALLIGLVHHRWAHLRRAPPWLLHAGAFALIVLWLAQPRLGDAPQPFLLQAGWVWLAGVLGVALSSTGGARPQRQGAMLAATAIGFSGPALFAATASIAQLGATLAAALLGVLAASRPAGLGHPTVCVVLPAGGLVLGLGAILVMFSEAEPWLLGLACLALLADRASRRIARSRRRERWLFVLLCVLPPALAMALAKIVSGPLGGF